MKKYFAVRPYDDQVGFPGQRLVVERSEGDESINIIEEEVLPERVARIDARRRNMTDWLILNPDEARWLRDRLTELLS